VYLFWAVGKDTLGAQAQEQVRQWGVLPDYVARLEDKQTGCCLVTLDEHLVPSYDLLQDVAYDHIPCNELDREFDVLYFGTLALRSEENLRTLKTLLETHHFGEVFVDVNIRPPYYCAETVRFAVENATILKVSDEELPVLCGIFGIDPAIEAEAAAKLLTCTFPKLRCVLITLGADGAYALSCAEGAACRRGGEPVEVRSTVGAGDSFSAAFLAMRLRGCSVEHALEHAVKVAGFVVSEYDAVPDYRAEVFL